MSLSWHPEYNKFNLWFFIDSNLLTWTTSKSVTVSAEETIIIGIITDLVKACTLCVLNTLRLACVGVSVTEVLCITISVIIAAAGVRGLVTHRSWVHTVQIIIMAS